MVDRIDLDWGRELNKEFAEESKNEKIEAGNALDATAREILSDIFSQETRRSPDVIESVINQIETELLEADSTAKSAIQIALEDNTDLSKAFIKRVADDNEHIVDQGIKEREKRIETNRQRKKEEPSGP
jgi:hypothetical protein